MASMLVAYSRCFSASGSISGAPKYQNSMCASSGTLRIASTYETPSARSHRDGDRRSIATVVASGTASTSVTAVSCSDSTKPATSASWYWPDSSREKSKESTGTAVQDISARGHAGLRLPDPRKKPGKVAMDRLPDNLEIHLEITVGQGIAHLVGERQRQLGVLSREFGAMLFDVVAGLSDDF